MRPTQESAVTSIANNFCKQIVQIAVTPSAEGSGTKFLFEKDILSDSLVIDYRSSTGDSAVVGSVIAPDLSVTLYDADNTYANVDLMNATLRVSVTVIDTDENTSVFNMGTFYVDAVDKRNEYISLKALGKEVLLDQPFDPTTYTIPTSLYDFAAQICSKCGFTAIPLSDVASELANADLRIGQDQMPESGKYTCREVLGFVCQLMACNATLEYQTAYFGERIVFKSAIGKYASIPVTDSNRFAFEASKKPSVVTGCTATNATASYSAGNDTGTVIELANNPVLNKISRTSFLGISLEKIAKGVLDKLKLLQIDDIYAETLPMPFVQPMDRIVTGDFYMTIIDHVVYRPNRNTIFYGHGFKKKELADYTPFTQQQDAIIKEMASDAKTLEESISDVRSNVSNLSSNVSGLTSRLVTVEGKTTTLQSVVSDHSDSISDIEQNVSNLEDATDSLSADVDDLQTTAEKLSYDYIAEHGSDGTWKWRKWKSGTVEMWATGLQVTLGGSSAWTNELVYMTGSFAYPINLQNAGTSHVQCTVTKSPDEVEINGLLLVVIKQTTGAQIRFVRKAATSRVSLDVYVKGKVSGALADEAIADEAVLSE